MLGAVTLITITHYLFVRMNKWLVLLILIIIAAVAVFAMKSGGPTVKLSNASEFDVSPGVIVLHDETFSMNHLGLPAPTSYQTLAEIGDPSDIIRELEGTDGVLRVIGTDHIAPGAEESVSLGDVTGEGFPENLSDIRVSYMGMIVQTNDGVVWINSVPLEKIVYKGGAADPDQVHTYWAEIIDMGSEENSPLASGFDGGQPDPTRGEENIDNGTATEETVSHHTQFYDDPEVTMYVLGFVRGSNTDTAEE